MTRKNSDGGVDHDTHHLLDIREPPTSVIALRQELAKLLNSPIIADRKLYKAVASQPNFELCLAELAARLDILLDGTYDAADLCDLLVTALRQRHSNTNQPHLRDKRLVSVELVEREDSVTVEVVPEGQDVIVPETPPAVEKVVEVAAHTCHWPGCDKEVPPKMWGCHGHWFALPKYLRDKIWSAYRKGQEITKTPSAQYLAVAKEVQDWIAANYKDGKRIKK